MFEGAAEEAATFYVSLFNAASITRIERYGPEGPGAEGKVKGMTFTLAGRDYLCFDSPVHHAFTFTASISIFVECEDAAEFERLYGQLSANGQVFMEPANYGFSTRFAWVGDRFGVSWQLNLA
jgi:predicted 3-demethylubiquinone-9 3-methyltransferase (glyoxalase superfamily)